MDGAENEWANDTSIYTAPTVCRALRWTPAQTGEEEPERRGAGRGGPFLCSQERPPGLLRSRGGGGAARRRPWPPPFAPLPQPQPAWPRSPKRCSQGPCTYPALWRPPGARGRGKARAIGIAAFISPFGHGVRWYPPEHSREGPVETRTHPSLNRRGSSSPEANSPFPTFESSPIPPRGTRNPL